MAAVALAWESQSTKRVGCSAAPKQAAKFTAVVVFPTPPFWFATAIIRANPTPSPGENLAKRCVGCKLFHVEHSRFLWISTLCSTWNIARAARQTAGHSMFHVEHSPAAALCFGWQVLPIAGEMIPITRANPFDRSTWNTVLKSLGQAALNWCVSPPKRLHGGGQNCSTWNIRFWGRCLIGRFDWDGTNLGRSVGTTT